MKGKISAILIALFWLLMFGFVIYKGYVVVAVLSAILLGMTMAISMSNEI